MFGKTKKPEINPLTPEARADLQSELEIVTQQIQGISATLAESFEQRMLGIKEDGDHNRFADMLTMKLESLRGRQTELMGRIERINVGMAKTALVDTKE